MKNPVKPVSEILDQGRVALSAVMPSGKSGSQQSDSEKPKVVLSADSIEVLFQTFARRWSHKWEKTFTDKKARALWKHDLQMLDVTDSLMTIGLHKSAGLGWPPVPAEFAALCHPTAAELGLPDLDTAYRHACVSNWSHPAVYEAAKRIGTFEIRSMPESKSRPLFERVYRAVCAEVLAGATFVVPKRTAIEHRPQPTRREVALEHLAKMKAMVGAAR